MSLGIKGQDSTFDLQEFSVGDVCRLGSKLRRIETAGRSSEEISQSIAECLVRSFYSHELRRSQLSLVEVFQTRNLGEIPIHRQERWVQTADGAHASAQTRVLALMGVAGDSVEWTVGTPPFGRHCIHLQEEFD